MPSKTDYLAALQTTASCLLTENGYNVSSLEQAPSSQLRDIIAQLLCIRSPSMDPFVDQRLYAAVDTLLSFEAKKVVVTEAKALIPFSGTNLILWQGDITTLKADAIVNAANSALLGCFDPSHRCIDNVIHSKAGPGMRDACCDIVVCLEGEGGLPVGQVVATPGFNLPAEHVFHTVGPQVAKGFAPTETQNRKLILCYLNSLDLALTYEKDFTIAFPCISTGLYGFPSELAAPLVINAVKTWVTTHPKTANWKIIFNTFLDEDFQLYKRILEQVTNTTLPSQISTTNQSIAKAKSLIRNADFFIISAGAGLSASAGLDYTSELLFKTHHGPMHRRGFRKMYQFIGFHDWTPALQWGYFFKQTSLARYSWRQHATQDTYLYLKSLVDEFETKNSSSTFVVTSNADGMFDQYGFEKDRIYTRQGDYSRIQCLKPCRQDSVWDMQPFMEKGLASLDSETYEITDSDSIPKCKNCGGACMLNVRGGDWFLEGEYAKQEIVYEAWKLEVLHKVKTEGKKLVILEMGAGFNTPGVLRYPNERLAEQLDGISLVRVNKEFADIPVLSEGVGVSLDNTDFLKEL
ncbi:hypothetical protein HK100_003405 [Physocladia obscura]|uniref:Protein-ADP-ribose hydrolase n=1 Tax=Physocladia obscura TaxID=109957 RepID=A0AAD5T022_9FUNG|nr:hypothetical protein HK100_003405 [Physocladia obscura]